MDNEKKKVQEDRIHFNGFTFPRLITVEYLLDGKDKEHPSEMFIADRDNRFLFSFDVKMKNLELMVSGKEDYENLDILYEGRRYFVCYPCQEKKQDLYMGYFSIEIKDEEGRVYDCVGQLSISPPIKYMDGMKNYKEIKEILSGVKLG